MAGLLIALSRALHLLGVVFWIGGIGARLVLLGSAGAGAGEAPGAQLYEIQRKIHLRLEIPAFLLALVTGLLLVYAQGVTFGHAWFSVKMLLLVGIIVVDVLASRRFKRLRTGGEGVRAADVGTALVALVLLILFVAVSRF
jgi:uncharacterized membrane protein